MSWGIDILVNTPESLEGFVKELETNLDIKLQLKSDNNETWYEYNNSQVYLTVGENDFENESVENFEAYGYHIALWPHQSYKKGVQARWLNELAPAIFQKLKTTQRYSLLMLEDGQKELDKYNPTRSTLTV